MRHLTTAYAFNCRKVDAHGLRQSMLRRSVQLSESAIILAAAETWFNIDASWFDQMRFRTMENTMRNSFKAWRLRHDVKFPLPTMEQIDLDPTEVFYLGAVHANSGTVEGTAQAHEHIMKHELNIPIEPSDDVLNDRLFLWGGDQKTVEYCRSARNEHEDSECTFNRRNWMLPLPALFHVEMNLSTALLRAFWSPYNKPGDRLRTTHCILADMQRLGFKNITQDNAPWYDLHRLLQIGYHSRVFAMFLQCLEAHGRIRKENHKSAESLQDILSGLNPTQFDSVWDSVHKLLFSRHATKGELVVESDDGTPDEIWRLPDHITTLARFVQTTHVYVVLHQAMRYGDVQTIRHLLPLLALIFFGTEKHKYGREMLYLSWLLNDKVSDPKLQDAILNSMLINISGRRDSFLAVDRFLEHINAVLKIDQKMDKNSTHDWRQTFHSTVRIIPYLAGHKKAMERMVSYAVKGKHHVKDMSSDILDYAIKLWHDGQVDWTVEFSNQYVADNVVQQGLERLPKAVRSFNDDVVDRPDRPFTTAPPAEKESNDAGVDGLNTVSQVTAEMDPPVHRMTAEESTLEQLGQDGVLDDIAAYYGDEPGE